MKSSVLVAALLVAALAVGCSKEEAEKQEAKPATTTAVVVLDESNFDSEIQSGVVLVDFWATWCGPCRRQGPIVDQVAEQFKDKAKVCKLDVDAASNVAKKYKIQSIPTLILFKDGKPEKHFVGVTKAETLVSAINSVIDSE